MNEAGDRVREIARGIVRTYIRGVRPTITHADMVDAIAAALQAQGEPGWREIGSAPKTGEVIWEKALKRIDAARYSDRSTVNEQNAFEQFGKLNRQFIEICDIAREALAQLAALPSPSEGAKPPFNCNCPHEVRSGCSDPECPHYVPAKPPQGAVTEEMVEHCAKAMFASVNNTPWSEVDPFDQRYGRNLARACLTAAQAVATEQGEVGAVSHIIDPKTFNLLKRALRPFAATVFNDNGDVTIDTSRLHTTDYMAAQKAFDALEHEQSGEAKG